ncbi:MAG: histidine kinase, partial [Bacteroidota bacterium]
LERLRLNNKFDFEIVIDENIDADELQVPPMLLQPFIENSIKHGLRPKIGKGRLTLEFILKNDKIFCFIEDNGIGREAAQKAKKTSPNHISKGVEITRKRLDSITKNNNKGNLLVIKDLTNDDNKSTGTRVELLIPFRYF